MPPPHVWSVDCGRRVFGGDEGNELEEKRLTAETKKKKGKGSIQQPHNREGGRMAIGWGSKMLG
jgi:hypothetical protein